MGYLFNVEVFLGGGEDFGGPVTEGGSHAKKVGDHWPRSRSRPIVILDRPNIMIPKEKE